jgi:hypothetical protein
MQTPSPRLRIIQAARAAIVPALLLFAFGVAQFAYAGTYARYWADDYCYSATVKQLGIIRGVADWYQHSGNRLSTLAAVALSELFGPSAIRYVPGAVLMLWAAAWAFFLARLRREVAPKAVPTTSILLLSLVMAYFAALLAPDRLQTVYWRMGTFHYSLPAPLLLLNLGLLLGAWHARGRLVWATLGAGLLAFFTAGLSETFAALQAGLFLTGLAAAVIFLRNKRRARALMLTGIPLLGTLLMMLVMMNAPANQWRQEVMPPPENLFMIVPYSLRYAADFVFYAMRGAPVPFAVFALVIFCAVLLGLEPAAARLSARRSALGIGLSLLFAYLFIVCSFAPSAFADLAYPAGRALMPGHFALLAGLGAAAGFAALLARALIPPRLVVWVAALAGAALLAASLYPLRVLPVVRQDVAALAVRAERWDARSAQIRADIATGQLEVQTHQVDVVQSLEDIGPRANFWINRCAAVYYGANTIIANP